MIWFEGEVRDDGRVPFDLRDRGLALADGLFETLLVVGGVAYRLADHLGRMERAATVLRIAIDPAVVRRAVVDLAARLPPAPSVVRVTATRGAGARGLRAPRDAVPTIFATSAPWSPELAFRAQRLATAGIRRNDASPLSRIKSLAYLDNVLALEEATASGADDALLLSTRGRVACASAANLFVIRGNELATPPVADGVLPGIVRSRILSLGGELGLQAVERSVLPGEMAGADGAFATNSVRLVSPVISIDGVPFRGGRPDVVPALTDALRREIEAECGTPLPVA